MVSLRRREVIIAGLATAVAPAAFAALPAPTGKLILSGRLLGKGKPVAGVTITAGNTDAVTDADGRFILILDSRTYRGVTCDGRPVEGFVSNRRRDGNGTWRATVGLKLA